MNVLTIVKNKCLVKNESWMKQKKKKEENVHYEGDFATMEKKKKWLVTCFIGKIKKKKTLANPFRNSNKKKTHLIFTPRYQIMANSLYNYKLATLPLQYVLCGRE